MTDRLPGSPPVIPGFHFIRPLGAGGFSDVFLFEQDRPQRQVAVKVLLHRNMDTEVLQMFNTEADTLALLSAHPAILTIYQAGISADGRPYLVTEYCPSSYARRYREEYIPVPEVLALGVRLGSAVESSHRSGVIHRDIKPSNLLVNEIGALVLSDFGIAAVGNTDAGVEAMSVPWSAPEVINGKVMGTVASDIWSLGATIYGLLAGRSPFEEVHGQNSSERLKARISKARYTPIERTDIPSQLEDCLSRAMAKDPAKRYPSAAAFAEDLQRIQMSMNLPLSPLEYASAPPLRVDPSALRTDRGEIQSTVPMQSQRRRIQPRDYSASKRTKDSSNGIKRSTVVWIVVGAVAATVAVMGILVAFLGGM